MNNQLGKHSISYEVTRFYHVSKAMKTKSTKEYFDEQVEIQKKNKTRAVMSESDIEGIKSMKIGSTSIKINVDPSQPCFVPVQQVPQQIKDDKILLQHLKWIAQKDNLGQDMFLIGHAGPIKRNIIKIWANLCRREIEYVSITRDTSEHDLKQRREISGGNAYYVDQAAVKAALNGRVLVLDGIEKAERNVLPLLNGLLEARELALEDGRFLISHKRFSDLQKSKDETTQRLIADGKLVPVHPDFRVIAIGLPVSLYGGLPLDPPLRSRFQAREIQNPDTESILSQLPPFDLPEKVLSSIISFAQAISSLEDNEDDSELREKVFPPFPVSNVISLLSLLNLKMLTSESLRDLVWASYPLQHLLKPKTEDNEKSVLMEVLTNEVEKLVTTVSDALNLPKKHSEKLSVIQSSDFVPLPTHKKVVHNMLLSLLSQRDVCLIGQKGSGKSIIARQVATSLEQLVDYFPLYKEMTSRDLVMRRTTDSEGNTQWQESPLIRSIVEGHVCILDGIDRLSDDILISLSSLMHERSLHTIDGARYIKDTEYDALASKYGESYLDKHRIKRVHPNFRIIGLSLPPTEQSNQDKKAWFSAETMNMMHFHTMPNLPREEQHLLLKSLAKVQHHQLDQLIYTLLDFKDEYNEFGRKEAGKKDAKYISFRDILHVVLRVTSFPNENLFENLQRVTMIQYLPTQYQKGLMNLLKKFNIQPTSSEVEFEVKEEENSLSIGDISVPKRLGSKDAYITDTFYVHTPEHSKVMYELLQDYKLHQHSLLIGNQGVGKNKITDQFLKLLSIEREYHQLHRDITISSLTSQPTVVDGVLKFIDSPLVRAVQFGRTIVLDEGDKAPLEVISIIKSLIEDGEMVLGDGRRIVRDKSSYPSIDPEKLIEIHPNFRIMVLANRPNFPFQGNDFFRECGDIFSSHYVDNPLGEHELTMLKAYAPNVSDEILMKLIDCFADLRVLVSDGVLQYPYSTRELVAIAKHLEEYPDDGVVCAIQNVLAFDMFNDVTLNHLRVVFQKHGLPLDVHHSYQIKLAESKMLEIKSENPEISLLMDYGDDHDISIDNYEYKYSKLKDPTTIKGVTDDTNKENNRVSYFSEHKYSIPFKSDPFQLVTLKDNSFHIMRSIPMTLFSYHPDAYDKVTYYPLSSLSYLSSPKMVPLDHLGKLGIVGLSYYTDNSDSKFSTMLNRNSRKVAICCYKLNQFSENAIEKVVIHKTQYTAIGAKAHIVYNEMMNSGGIDRSLLYFEGLPYIELISYTKKGVSFKSFDTNLKIESIVPFAQKKFYVRTTSGKQHILTISKNKAKIVDIERPTPLMNPLAISENILVNVTNRDQTEYVELEKGRVLIKEVAKKSKLNRHTTDMVALHSSNTNAISQQGLGGLLVGQANSRMRVIDWKYKRYVDLIGADEATTTPVIMASRFKGSKSLITIHTDHKIRIWELDIDKLQEQATYWKQFMKGEDSEQTLTINSSNVPHENPNLNFDNIQPKHGKEDELPHVGGSQFAGGSGGQNTAGMGGVGGPYRLDKGHDVHQLSDEVKKNISKEAQARARQMGKEAYQKRLAEINMSDGDASTYDTFYKSIETQIQLFRDLLANLRAKEKERIWLRHQSHGELDDQKIVEGITGEKNIYKRRAKGDDHHSFRQKKKKAISFVLDCSGSMYRFNGMDKRMFRMMELAVLIMEGMKGSEEKYKYEIIGHSGETSRLSLVSFDKPPKNKNDRLKVVLKMHAHSQFCWSGDSTVDATKNSIKRLAKEDADERFVFLFSDANLNRYGISPKKLGKHLVADANVKAFMIFIASLNDEADLAVKLMPSGHAHVCYDTSKLSKTFQNIFTSHVLDD